MTDAATSAQLEQMTRELEQSRKEAQVLHERLAATAKDEELVHALELKIQKLQADLTDSQGQLNRQTRDDGVRLSLDELKEEHAMELEYLKGQLARTHQEHAATLVIFKSDHA